MVHDLNRKMLGIVCGVLMMMVGMMAHADEALPKEGALCDRAHWGELSSIVVKPTLECVRGVWKIYDKLPKFDVVLNVRDKDGRLVFDWFANNVPEGTRQPFVSWKDVSVPVRGPNNSLAAVKTRFGDGFMVMPTVADDQADIRVEGYFQRNDRDMSWNQAFDKTVHPGEETGIATRPDGVTYYLRVSKVQD